MAIPADGDNIFLLITKPDPWALRSNFMEEINFFRLIEKRNQVIHNFNLSGDIRDNQSLVCETVTVNSRVPKGSSIELVGVAYGSDVGGPAKTGPEALDLGYRPSREVPHVTADIMCPRDGTKCVGVLSGLTAISPSSRNELAEFEPDAVAVKQIAIAGGEREIQLDDSFLATWSIGRSKIPVGISSVALLLKCPGCQSQQKNRIDLSVTSDIKLLSDSNLKTETEHGRFNLERSILSEGYAVGYSGRKWRVSSAPNIEGVTITKEGNNVLSISNNGLARIGDDVVSAGSIFSLFWTSRSYEHQVAWRLQFGSILLGMSITLLMEILIVLTHRISNNPGPSKPRIRRRRHGRLRAQARVRNKTTR